MPRTRLTFLAGTHRERAELAAMRALDCRIDGAGPALGGLETAAGSG